VAIRATYVHTNLVARNWRRLFAFYQSVLGCMPVPPERNLVEPWVEAATRVPGAEIHGMHLRLPGWGEQGPTLEIFQYAPEMERPTGGMNRPGFGHLAFKVDDVDAAREAVIAAGGGVVGETVHVSIRGAGQITFVYVTDPEGNVLELQHWP
jgi:predicted enzyme related to lactoylglutathione lyase